MNGAMYDPPQRLLGAGPDIVTRSFKSACAISFNLSHYQLQTFFIILKCVFSAYTYTHTNCSKTSLLICLDTYSKRLMYSEVH